jgi:tetratricopeptide (TPR) repeat protein
MYEDERRKNTKAILLPEVETNLLGYQLMQNGNTKDALTILKMNNEAYPASANTYDSVSDALLAAGDRAGALKYATKAFEMLEKDAEAPPEFKQLVRESAEKKIKELKS